MISNSPELRAVLVFTLSLLSAGCSTPLPGEIVSKSYKVGTPRTQLISLVEQQSFVCLASRTRPTNGWPTEKHEGKITASDKLKVFASDFERENPGTIVHLGEVYMVLPKRLALSIPDPSGDTLDEYHYWFFDAQTNLLGHTIQYDHYPLTWK